MLLWQIWHPKYGVIFDLGRDSPPIVTVTEKVKSRDRDQESVIQIPIQLNLLPV